MYKLPYYTEADQEKVIAFMKEHPFAMIAGQGEEYPVATQIPLAIETKGGKLFLHGHMMKKTDHQLAFEKNNKVLVLFNGPHCYISASWYGNSQMASTWDYMTVHARGRLNFLDEKGTHQAIRSITEQYEGKDTEAAFTKLSPEYVSTMIKAIIGFTIELESFENVFKLSQNRDPESKKNIIRELKKRKDENSRLIAKEMETRLQHEE